MCTKECELIKSGPTFGCLAIKEYDVIFNIMHSF